MQKHLAIFDRETAEKILSGQKTIETRFSKHKIAPFGVISKGDLVYIKPSGEDIIGQFRVKKVIFFEGLEAEDNQILQKSWGEEIPPSNYGSLIFIDKSERFLTSPVKIKKRDMRGWVVLG